MGAPSYAGMEIRPSATVPDQPDPLNLVVDCGPKPTPPQ